MKRGDTLTITGRSEEVAHADATLRENADLRRALDVAMEENDRWRALVEPLQADLYAAHTLLGRVDYFLETYAGQPPAAQRTIAARLRREIREAGRRER